MNLLLQQPGLPVPRLTSAEDATATAAAPPPASLDTLVGATAAGRLGASDSSVGTIDRGGVFEYVLNTPRTDEQAVASVLAGRSDRIVSCRHFTPGGLVFSILSSPASLLIFLLTTILILILFQVIFRGRSAMHRVTPVHAAAPPTHSDPAAAAAAAAAVARINAIFTYARTPNMRLNAYTQQTFFGRVRDPSDT